MGKQLKVMNRVLKNLEGDSNVRKIASIIKKTQMVMDFEAIPLEQLKGDIVRQGYQVKRIPAVDVEGHRLFFVDSRDQYLYAQFGSAKDGYKIDHIGHQSSIVKEYDVIDLDPSKESGNPGEKITTTDDEEEQADDVGMYPGSTPVNNPEDDDRGFSGESKTPTRKLIKELEDDSLEEEVCK